MIKSPLRDHYGFLAREKIDGLWAHYPTKSLPKDTWSPIGLKQLLLPTGLDIVAMDCQPPETPGGDWILGSALIKGETFAIQGKESFRQLSMLRGATFCVALSVEGSLGFSARAVVQLSVTLNKHLPAFSPQSPFFPAEMRKPTRRNFPVHV